MNNLMFGSFYTRNTAYENVYQEYLRKSLDKYNARYMVVGIDSKKNWNKNVAEKPRIISELLKPLEKDEMLVFLDADATIEKWPVLFEQIPEDYDIGFHLLSWQKWYGYDTETYELLTGTMFFRNNEKVHALCKEWYHMSLESYEWEQKVLQNIISNHKLNIYELPLEYCYMKTRPGGLEPLVKLDPVILHHQVSRELKGRLK